VAGIMLTCGIAQAQSTGNGGERHGFTERGRRSFGLNHEGIRYTPEQRRQLMAINKEYHDKSAELLKKDNITLKEYKAGLIALQKDRRSKMGALLTPQQKEQLASRKKMAEENRQVAEAAQMERLKLRLGLSDDQLAKIKAKVPADTLDGIEAAMPSDQTTRFTKAGLK